MRARNLRSRNLWPRPVTGRAPSRAARALPGPQGWEGGNSQVFGVISRDKSRRSGKRDAVSSADSPQMTTQPDYYLITFMTDERPYPWAWEIKRHSKPMGIRFVNGGYQSKASAVIAGRRALLEFLEELAKEEKRKR